MSLIIAETWEEDQAGSPPIFSLIATDYLRFGGVTSTRLP